jgi:hypothetical protein
MISLSTNLKERNMAADFCGYEGNVFESFSSFQAGSSLIESLREESNGTSAVAPILDESYKMRISFICSDQEQIKDTIINRKRRLDDTASKEERRKAHRKVYDAAHREREAARKREYYAAHKELEAARQIKYRAQASHKCQHGKRKNQCDDCDGK